MLRTRACSGKTLLGPCKTIALLCPQLKRRAPNGAPLNMSLLVRRCRTEVSLAVSPH
ncbi:unnamed protein product [Ixodes pacificus]